MSQHTRMYPLVLLVLLVAVFLPDTAGAAFDPQRELERQLQAGSYEQVRALLDEHPGLELDSALVQALHGKHDDLARLLVLSGADADGAKHRGLPVYLVAKYGNADLLQFLLGQGADVDAEPADGQSNIGTPLLQAIYYGELDAVQLLLDAGAQVNHVSRHDNTPLHQAVRYAGTGDHQMDIMRLLLKYGADPDQEDGTGMSVRLAAEVSGNAQLRELITQFRPAAPVRPLQAARFTYTLDRLAPETVSAGLLDGRLGTFVKYPTDDGPIAQQTAGEEGVGRASCETAAEFIRVTTVEGTTMHMQQSPSVLVALCGHGGFDANHIQTTIKLAEITRRSLLNQVDATRMDATQRAAFDAMQARVLRISDTETVYSFILMIIGHGVLFIPTGVVLDSATNTSLVVQLMDDEGVLSDTAGFEQLALSLYRQAKGE